MVMWDEIAAEVAKDFPNVQTDKMLVDAMTCRMVLQPQSIDTIVATNLVSESTSPEFCIRSDFLNSTRTSSQTSQLL